VKISPSIIDNRSGCAFSDRLRSTHTINWQLSRRNNGHFHWRKSIISAELLTAGKKKGGNRQNKRWGPRLGETEFAASVVPSIGESVVCVSMTERHPTLNPVVNQNNNEKV
jgi:hypothetical protein